MKRTFLPLALLGALLIGACSGDTGLPEATGKASIRAINAIPTSQEISFLIEERLIGTAPYQGITSKAEYDDLEYTFNVEAFYADGTDFRRFASQFLDVEANKDYTFLVSGDLASPTITVWQDDEREFDETDTVFAASFSHASASLGDLDYYFADSSIAPALGNEVATLSNGEISAVIDFPAGDFVLTITTAGDPGDVVYTSSTTTFIARDTIIFTSFDGDISDTAPVFVRGFSNFGANVALPDINFPPTVQFVNASMDLGNVDIYDDETLTSQRVANHGFLDATADLDVTIGANIFYYTPAGDTSAVTIEAPLTAFGGLRYRFVAIGLAGNLNSLAFIPDVRPVETQAKLLPYNASNNFAFVDLYAVEPGTSVDDVFPVRAALAAGAAPSPVELAAGGFDLYLTSFAEKSVLAGPYRIDVALGDVVDFVIVDTVDPAVLDIAFLSGGPTP